MRHLRSTLFVVALMSSTAATATADQVSAKLEGCVALTDLRLAEALWFASGTFQAVAFDDETPGCEPTIARPVRDAYVLDERRRENTLSAQLNMGNLPTCGRRQYDVHYYLDNGVLDPMGLKSLVIDTGIPCTSEVPTTPPPKREVPEPGTFALLASGVGYALWRRKRRRASPTEWA